MKIMMIKGLDNKFTAAYDSDYDNIRKIKPNTMVEVTITRKRNIGFHRKAFALFKMVYSNQERYDNITDLRHDLTIAAGYWRKYVNIHGDVVKVAHSISFASMDETEFNKYYDDVIKIIVLHFHFDREDILENVARYF